MKLIRNSIKQGNLPVEIRWIFLFFTYLLGQTGIARAGADDQTSRFNFEVRPILAAKCFQCHGADERTRKGKLRLDDEAAARASGVLESKLLSRIQSNDPEEQMPPPKSHQSLNTTEQQTLKAWLEQGAPYAKHWAFVAPVKRAPPATASPEDEIDTWLGEKLRKAGLDFSPPAEKPAWLRRVTFTLTGLPPNVDEMESYEKDQSPEADERVVDRLLKSSAYGEEMATHWLDLARYADSYGRHEDTESFVWPWRDWVINAFNQNLPYSQFITEQLAGDLLPKPTVQQKIATAFNRLAQQSNESGSNEIEFRLDQVADRVKTASTTFLGLTLECAKCHDHKFDPVSTKEYWQVAAFFDNINERGVYSQYCPLATPTPSIPLYSKENNERLEFFEEKLAASRSKLETVRKEAKSRFAEWLKKEGLPHSRVEGTLVNYVDKANEKYPRGTPWSLGILAGAGLIGSAISFRKNVKRGILLLTAATPLTGWLGLRHYQNSAWNAEPVAHYVLQAKDKGEWTNVVNAKMPGKLLGRTKFAETDRGRVIELHGDDEASFPSEGDFRRHDPFSFVLWLKPAELQERAVVLHRSMAGVDDGRGYELIMEKGRLSFALSHFFPGNEIRVQTEQPLPTNVWTCVAVSYDGSSKAAGIHLFWNGTETKTTIIQDSLSKDIDRSAKRGDTQVEDVELQVGGRRHDMSLRNCQVGEFWIFNRAISATEARCIAEPKSKIEPDDWFDWYLATKDDSWQRAMEEQRNLRKMVSDYLWQIQDIMVMEELPQPRPTFVHNRGDYRQPTEQVEPNTPNQILPFAKDLPRNRLGLAQWLVDAKNPLTARVQVNRIWQIIFGTGLVSTPEDFGIRGEVPSHPELLDSLAVDFRESGWDIKKLIKRIILTKAFRQSSRSVADKAYELDPNNRLLSRGPSARMDAEEIRDQALAVSGLLTPGVGGPPVRPYLPDNLYKDSGLQQKYVQDQGQALYRRSLYTFWRRTLPPPDQSAFDAPTRDYCVARRSKTVTPSQALVLLDAPQFVEAARVMAENLVRKFPLPSDDDKARVNEAFRRLMGRTLTAKEETVLTDLLAAHRKEFVSNDKLATEFVSQSGQKGPDTTLPATEVAATALMVRILFGHEESLHLH